MHLQGQDRHPPCTTVPRGPHVSVHRGSKALTALRSRPSFHHDVCTANSLTKETVSSVAQGKNADYQPSEKTWVSRTQSTHAHFHLGPYTKSQSLCRLWYAPLKNGLLLHFNILILSWWVYLSNVDTFTADYNTAPVWKTLRAPSTPSHQVSSKGRAGLR